MTFTEDRETFERDIFKPPHLARMLDVAGEFTGRLDKADREWFLCAAMEQLWEMRESVKVMNDINRLWVLALEETAWVRPYWIVAISHFGVKVGTERVKSAHLRRVP